MGRLIRAARRVRPKPSLRTIHFDTAPTLNEASTAISCILNNSVKEDGAVESSRLREEELVATQRKRNNRVGLPYRGIHGEHQAHRPRKVTSTSGLQSTQWHLVQRATS
ncbi:hypothetical protein BP5796_08576 [Coleophoma crateriformis]|uniref:Uncharacterized protein n=1 Tax=Coleophoma crateriformis TaxID=565419 RepID=A0A3D8R806_9HELO|nr:hypothetical protein BP5796_08576 [Coleophoma crateriformis]